jgi:hypothetical protein
MMNATFDKAGGKMGCVPSMETAISVGGWAFRTPALYTPARHVRRGNGHGNQAPGQIRHAISSCHSGPSRAPHYNKLPGVTT